MCVCMYVLPLLAAPRSHEDAHGLVPGLVTIPDPMDECNSHLDYVDFIDKTLVMGPPLTAGEGEFDMSPGIFGLDDECARHVRVPTPLPPMAPLLRLPPQAAVMTE